MREVSVLPPRHTPRRIGFDQADLSDSRVWLDGLPELVERDAVEEGECFDDLADA